MSKEAIINELPEEFVRKMRNWAKTGTEIGSCPISSAYVGGRIGSGTFGPSIPTWGGEVSDLQRAIDSLKERERLAVRLFWLQEGQDLVGLGRRLHCDYRAAERRVRKGHEEMLLELGRREAWRDFEANEYRPGVIHS